MIRLKIITPYSYTYTRLIIVHLVGISPSSPNAWAFFVELEPVLICGVWKRHGIFVLWLVFVSWVVPFFYANQLVGVEWFSG